MFSPEETRIYRVELPPAGAPAVQAPDSSGETGPPPARFYDPLALRRALLQAAGGDLVTLGERASSKPAEGEEENPGQRLAREQAKEELLGCIRTAFDLPAVDLVTGEGYTESTCWRVWNDYCTWAEGEPPAAGS